MKDQVMKEAEAKRARKAKVWERHVERGGIESAQKYRERLASKTRTQP